MTDNDTLQMMRRCVSELKQLRQANAALSPAAHAYDTIAIMMRLLERPCTENYSEDLIFKLEREIEKIQSKDKENG